MKDIIERQQNIIDKLSKKLEVMEETTVPIGFLYTQLPNQSSPEQLWPNMEWTEVTHQYSGLFFRAEGSGSESFGQIQQANQSWISNINTLDYEFDFSAVNGHYGDQENYDLKLNSWTSIRPNGVQDEIFIYTTAGEMRPRNTAIKIWKRTS